MAVLRRGEIKRGSGGVVRVVIHDASSTGSGDFSCRVEFDPEVYPPSDIVGIDEAQAKELASNYVEKLFDGDVVKFEDERR